MDNRNVWTGILILAIVCMAFFLKPAHYNHQNIKIEELSK
jgi:hypothetical protein